ncbi:hypothetical protein [Rheinheimera sp.]|uniref:hypothetical protein n=1 Tax=Rheinheimera sp. TaxID=1869214 RepID=UPI004048289B
MSDINLIKTVLFNASTTQEAITRLSELGFTVRECTFTDNGYHIQADQINFVDVTFWQTKSLRCPLAVCINGNLFDYDDRRSFLAGQCETVELVPAASPDTTGQRLLTVVEIEDKFFDSIRNQITLKRYPLLSRDQLKTRLRSILREERRLKQSQAKGLSS